LEQIKSRGLYGLLFTNGTLISADVARSLVRMGWDKILLSLDGTREVNDRLRDRGCYDRVLRALDRLTAARSDRRLPLIGVGCVLTAPGLDEIPRLIRILGERGCDQLNLIRLVVNLPEQRVFALTEEHLARLRPVLLEALAAAEALGMATNFSQYLDAELVGQVERFQGVLLGPRTLAQPGATFWNALCFEPFANIVIQSTGAAGPCCMSGERPLASITNRTLEDVWYGREFTGLRQAILRRQPEPYCRICDLNVFEENQRLRHARGGL
jgi:MoaA/NifB/PqqE/SkfB family radical SAM enzyme